MGTQETHEAETGILTIENHLDASHPTNCALFVLRRRPQISNFRVHFGYQGHRCATLLAGARRRQKGRLVLWAVGL